MSAQEGLAPHSWVRSLAGWKCQWCDVEMSPGNLICTVGPPTDWEARAKRLESELAEARLERDEAITNGQDRIADLGAELDQAAGFIEIHKAENAHLLAVNATLREALEPFAKHIADMKFDLDNKGNELPDDQAVGWVYVTNGDFRRARAALAGHEQAGAGTCDCLPWPDKCPYCGEDAPTMTAEQMQLALIGSIRTAATMISRHLEEYHDFDCAPEQMPSEVESLRRIEHHLEGSLIDDKGCFIDPASPGKGAE